MTTRRAVLPILLVLPLLGVSCTVLTTKGGDGGVYRSTDSGESWEHTVSAGVDAKGKGRSIDRADVHEIVLDPSTSGGLYLATVENGLYVSSDRGGEWRKTGFSTGAIVDVTPDPQTPTIVYGASGKELIKSVDGSQTWRSVYTEASPRAVLASVDLDWFTPSRVYAGVSDGTLLVSDDYGTTWSILQTFPQPIGRISVSPNDSRVLFVALSTQGIWRSADRGETWIDVSESLTTFDGANRVSDVAFSRMEDNVVYIATDFGLLRSDDLGGTWASVQTLIEFGTLPLHRLAVSPVDPSELFVSVQNKLYRTNDRGLTWLSIETLETTRRIESIVYDPEQPSTIYLGVRSLKR